MIIPDIRIKYNGVKVRMVGAGMRKIHNVRLLETGIKSIRARLAKGIGEDDGPTEPLTKRYAIYKSRTLRRRAIRDLNKTGEMLAGIKPRYADDQRAVADASGRLGRMKARIYRDLLKFSPNDQAAMSDKATTFFKEQATQVMVPLTAGAGRRGPQSFGRTNFSPVTFGR